MPANRPRTPQAMSCAGARCAWQPPIPLPTPASSAARAALSLGRETFVPAPAYDEEHPEELSYRPFPIAPFLTATASVDDPALARIVHPDLGKTLEMLDQDGLGAADAAAARSADGAPDVGAAVQGRGHQPVEPDRRRRRRRRA